MVTSTYYFQFFLIPHSLSFIQIFFVRPDDLFYSLLKDFHTNTKMNIDESLTQ